MKIDYPIAIDDNYAIWNAFRNEYWPAAILSMRRGTSVNISLAKAATKSQKRSFSNY